MKNIAILASGEGTNAQKIIDYFEGNKEVRVALIVSNRKDAHVLERANRCMIPNKLVNKETFASIDFVKELKDQNIDIIALAGFLWMIPQRLIKAFQNQIINIHPALLPKYGGKGMYGMNVHRAVIDAGENESGITIHYVNEHYDEGKIIFQEKCSVDNKDTPSSLADKIHALEHAHYPRVLECILLGMN